MQNKAEIGIIGGTGFYDFFQEGEELEINTKFGSPSDKIVIGNLFGKKVAFLPRHGKKHHFPPHQIPYKANILSLKEIGVERIIGPTAVGSLKKDFNPGDFVICDQFIDFTKRRDSFFNGPQICHIEMAYPYCKELRKIALNEAREIGLKTHSKGTVVIIEGPRFSTLAESQHFSKIGGDVVNMTQYPEVVLASELGICYLNISLVTDYDAGIYEGSNISPVSVEDVLDNFNRNMDSLKKLVSAIIKETPERRGCDCKEKSIRALIK